MDLTRPFKSVYECVCFCVCVYLAAVASVALGAGATEWLQGILTDASVEAGLRVTLIDLILAVGASEAWAAGTGIAIDFVCARPSIEARAANISKNVNLNVEVLFSSYIQVRFI